MDYNVAFLITTYDRYNSLLKLYNRIKSEGDVYILDDGSIKPVDFGIVRRQDHLGKPGYYQTVTNLWEMIAGKSYDYYIMLPDDFYPVDNFVNIAISTWNNIQETDKICLNLFTEKSRYMKPCWNYYMPVDMGGYIRAQWVDMCFFCEVDFFKAMGYKTDRTFRDWEVNPELGSGVGSYISRRLHNEGYGMYQVKNSLFTVQKAGLKSKMNVTDADSLIYKIV